MNLQSSFDVYPLFPVIKQSTKNQGLSRRGGYADMVKLKLIGGAHQSYKTSEYLSQSPMNLSGGFWVPVTFGLDYQYQDIIIREVPDIIEKAIMEGLAEEGHGNRGNCPGNLKGSCF